MLDFALAELLRGPGLSKRKEAPPLPDLQLGEAMTTRMSLAEFKSLKRPKRSKFNAVRCEIDGIRFDSRAEAEFYQILKADKCILHVDVHPTVTLPGGIRYRPDFMVYRQMEEKIPLGPHRGAGRLFWEKSEVVEVKGAITQDFRRIRKLFDEFHPLGPLKVVRKTRKGWEAI